MKRQIEKFRIIAEADIKNGNTEKLSQMISDLIKQEKYEECEGIKQAIDNGRD